MSERGDKPGFYLIVSRSFIAENDVVSTVVCAPVYSEILGLATEVVVGTDEGVPRSSAVRCDFLMLMAKAKLTHFVGSLSTQKLQELDRSLRIALGMR
jgi:mRNA interferase MazF